MIVTNTRLFLFETLANQNSKLTLVTLKSFNLCKIGRELKVIDDDEKNP